MRKFSFFDLSALDVAFIHCTDIVVNTDQDSELAAQFEDRRENRRGQTEKHDHHLRDHRCGPYALDVALSPLHAGGHDQTVH
jgi:hypothetical protein